MWSKYFCMAHEGHRFAQWLEQSGTTGDCWWPCWWPGVQHAPEDQVSLRLRQSGDCTKVQCLVLGPNRLSKSRDTRHMPC